VRSPFSSGDVPAWRFTPSGRSYLTIGDPYAV
jgi:hypothetical protein